LKTKSIHSPHLYKTRVEEGDRWPFFLPNCPQFVITYLAAAAVGAVLVPFTRFIPPGKPWISSGTAVPVLL
jgi:acyl-CoA synthetase (AMP-forming)/AMP-acid ligase II